MLIHFKSSFAALEFHAALEVSVEDPHVPFPQRPRIEPASRAVILLQA